MIKLGHRIDAYARGRRDARAGRRPAVRLKRGYKPTTLPRLYRMGYVEERARMAREHRLAQLELPGVGIPVDATGGSAA